MVLVPELCEITPSHVVGMCPMQPRDLKRIHAEARVSTVLSLQHSDCHGCWDIDIAGLMATVQELGLTYAHRPIRASPDVVLRQVMRRPWPDNWQGQVRILETSKRQQSVESGIDYMFQQRPKRSDFFAR